MRPTGAAQARVRPIRVAMAHDAEAQACRPLCEKALDLTAIPLTPMRPIPIVWA